MTTKDKVLHLLKETPDFLSGEKLAQQLEVSRTSIWKAIKELEKAGYRFEHGPTGYRYLPSDVLDAKEIQQELRSFIPDLKVQTMLTSESTMKDAKLAAAHGDSVSKLFVADTQEQARGRFGRPFFAEPGRGIYMSLLLHPDKRFDELPQYTIIAASACVKAIESVTGRSASIKWVNDIYMDGKKVCGILTEMSMEQAYIHHIVIGVGINVRRQEFPEEIRDRAAAIEEQCGFRISRSQLIADIMEAFEEDYEIFLQTHDLKGLRDSYAKLLVNRDREVCVLDPKGEFRGTARGINDQGELLVERQDGSIEKVYAGEVSVRGVYGYV